MKKIMSYLGENIDWKNGNTFQLGVSSVVFGVPMWGIDF